MKTHLVFGLVWAFAAPLTASRLLDPVWLEAGSNPRGLVAVDFNADGFADAAVASFGSATLIGQACPADNGAIQVYRGSAAGLAPVQTLTLPGNAPRGLAAADVDGDGRPDLLASLYCSAQLAVFRQNSDGGFEGPRLYPVGAQPVGVAVWSREGQTWVAVANYGSSTLTLFKAADGGLQRLADLATDLQPTDVEFYPAVKGVEVLVAAYGGNVLQHLILGTDASVFSSRSLPVSGQPCKVVVGDLDGDGLADVSVARFAESAVSVFRGLPGGGLESVPASLALRGSHPNGLSLGRLGARFRLVAADRDSDHAELLEWGPQGLSSTAALALPDAQGNTGTYGPVESAVADINGDGLDDVLVTHMRSGRLAVLLQAPPAAPVVSSSKHPDPGAWNPATDLDVAWTAAPDLDAVLQFRVLLDQNPGTVPGADSPVFGPGGTYFRGLATGEHWVHVRAVDASGLAGETAHYRVRVNAALARENVYNWPNPVRTGRTTIRFPLLAPAAVEIRIYDEMGALVWSRDLAPSDTVAGLNQVLWDCVNDRGRAVANGGYVLSVRSGDVVVTKKIAVVR